MTSPVDAAIAAFGVRDKAALLVAMALVLASLAAGIGVLALRSRALGAAAVTALGVAGAMVAAVVIHRSWQHGHLLDPEPVPPRVAA